MARYPPARPPTRRMVRVRDHRGGRHDRRGAAPDPMGDRLRRACRTGGTGAFVMFVVIVVLEDDAVPECSGRRRTASRTGGPAARSAQPGPRRPLRPRGRDHR